MDRKISQAVILAGGKGERLKPYTDTMPKPMFPIAGIPFIERLIKQIKGFGIEDILILLGYMPDKIIDFLGKGNQYDVHINYDVTPVEYDTADRLVQARGKLDEVFLMMYCDNYCPIDFQEHRRLFNQNNALIQLSVYSNKDGYTRNNLLTDEEGRVILYDRSRQNEDLSGVDIGYALMAQDALDGIGHSLADWYPFIAEQGRLYATITDHRYYSIGSYDRMALTEEFFKDKKAVFLDREGTLNIRPPKACYIENPDDFVWLSGAKEAVRMLTDAGYITILISNQAGIARGIITVDDFNAINQKMQEDLKAIGTRIDHIYFCPHGWDAGCDCRKPRPGMLYQAQRDLSLNLHRCVLFGDDERDIQAGETAGCESILVSEDYPLIDAVKDYLDRESRKGR